MKRIQEAILSLAAVLLFVASAFVIWSGLAGDQVLDLPDPLLLLSFRRVFWVVGGAMLGSSGFLLWSRNRRLRLLVLIWVTLNLTGYHFGTWWHVGANLFACLGNLGVPVPLSPRVLHAVISVMLVALTSGSILLLLCSWSERAWRRHSGKRSMRASTGSGQAGPGD